MAETGLNEPLLALVTSKGESSMATQIMAVSQILDPRLIVVVLVTFALVTLWFKRRSLAHKLPNVAQDFLTRHVETVKKKYTYAG